MARDKRYIIDVEIGTTLLNGASLAVYGELYQLVKAVGRPFQRGWFCELARRLEKRIPPSTEGNECFIIPFPIVEHLYVNCRLAKDEFGWFWVADIANDSVLQAWAYVDEL